MSETAIVMTESDAASLRDTLARLARARAEDRRSLDRLRGELDRAQVLPGHAVDGRVVTLRSRVILRDESSGERSTYTLVSPEEADLDAGRLSVLAPVGMAILGCRQGQVVEWEVPAGVRRIRIERVGRAPRASGRRAAGEMPSTTPRSSRRSS